MVDGDGDGQWFNFYGLVGLGSLLRKPKKKPEIDEDMDSRSARVSRTSIPFDVWQKRVADILDEKSESSR